jgi:hypothetical protein
MNKLSEVEKYGDRTCNGGEGGIRTHGRLTATHALQACLLGHSSTSPQKKTYSVMLMAERVGFEPTLRLRGDRFSRAAP